MQELAEIDQEEGKKQPPHYDSAEMTELSSYVKGIFDSFKTSRIPFEAVWQECWWNFLGKYQPNLNWKHKSEGKGYRSKIFIKLTSLKCNTAHSKIADVLFSGRNVMPFDIEALEPDKFGIPAEAAKEASAVMKKRLKEHLKKIRLKKLMDIGILEMAVLGTSVMKGPIIDIKKVPQVRVRNIAGMPANQIDESINPFEVVYTDEIVPLIDRVSLWEYYVDANASSAQDSIGEIHFSRMLPAKFKQFAYQGGYDREAVIEAAKRINANDDDNNKYVQMADNYTGEHGVKDEKISVLEYWGLVPVQMLKDAGVECPADVDDEDSIEALVVLAGDGIVIKACVNPLGRRPFYVCPFKERPGQIYGVGVAEAMRDSQKMINSAARLLIDNKALSGNGMVAVNLDRINTKRTKDLEVYSGKTWYVKGNFAPHDAISSVQFPDVTMGLRELIEMFERFADEETGIPKYTHGEQGSFLNKTATGMSMLMTQANVNLKTVIENIDDYWIEPIVEAMGDFLNTVMGAGASIPLKYKATGADSMIAKEIKMENYMKFLQVTANPQDAIFMDRIKLMKAIARLLETDDVMRTDEEIKKIMAEMSNRSSMPSDLRSRLNIEKLYPLLTRNEQMQILKDIGIEPDNNIISSSPPQGGGEQSLSPLPTPSPSGVEAGTGGA